MLYICNHGVLVDLWYIYRIWQYSKIRFIKSKGYAI